MTADLNQIDIHEDFATSSQVNLFQKFKENDDHCVVVYSLRMHSYTTYPNAGKFTSRFQRGLCVSVSGTSMKPVFFLVD